MGLTLSLIFYISCIICTVYEYLCFIFPSFFSLFNLHPVFFNVFVFCYFLDEKGGKIVFFPNFSVLLLCEKCGKIVFPIFKLKIRRENRFSNF